jgi:endoglucanase
MKVKTIILPLCAAVLATCFWSSCGDDDNNDDSQQQQPVAVTLSASPSELSFPKTGGTQSITITSPSEVTVLSGAQWLKAVQKSVDGTSFVYDVTTTLNDSGAERSGELTLLAGNDSKIVKVVQGNTMNQTIAVQAGESVFQVDNLVEGIEANADALWISQTSDGFAALANNSGAERTGLILLKVGNTQDTIFVTQPADNLPALSLSSTAMELASQMYPAWNLGNTMEATGSGLGAETSWQKTKTSQALIDYVKSLGFRSVRIPCSWYIHCPNRTSGDYTINASWMARVKEIVTYCINAGLFVELNDHWDSGWLEELGFTSSTSAYTSVVDDEDYINGKIEILKNLWTQIATEMKDFDHHLIFAGLNEPFQNYNLFNGRAESLTPILLKYNQAFVNAVRATGGNNANRVLAVQGPATNIDNTVNYFKMPTDAVQNKLMVEVHYYDPYNFCLNEGAGYASVWNSENTLKKTFEKMRKKFSDNDIPVIIGEYAANWRAVSNQEKHDASIKAFYKAVSKWGPANGMIPFAWDTNYPATGRGTSGTGTIIDRAKLSVYGIYAYEGLKEGNSATVWMK